MADRDHPDLGALRNAFEHAAQIGRRIVVRVPAPLHPANQRLADFLGAEVFVTDVPVDRIRRSTRGRQMGDFVQLINNDEPAAGSSGANDGYVWQDYRASVARAHRRRDAGEEVRTCWSCKTELDVDVPVHSPQCKAVERAPKPKSAGEWDANAVITAFRAWADAHDGEPPTSDDWKSTVAGYPRYAVVVQLFGSWNDGIAAAGFEPRPSHREPLPEREPEADTGTSASSVAQAAAAGEPASRSDSGRRRGGPRLRWTPDAIIEAIQRWAAEHGEPPRAEQWRKAQEGYPPQSTAARAFGSWGKAIAAAGFTPRPRGGNQQDSSGRGAVSRSSARGHARPVDDGAPDEQQPVMRAPTREATDGTGAPEPRPAPNADTTSEQREVESPEGPDPSRSSDVVLAEAPPDPLSIEILDGDKAGWIDRLNDEADRLIKRAGAVRKIVQGLIELQETDV